MKKFYDRVREMNELMELQRQAYPKKYSPARLEETVTEMKRRLFRGKEVTKGGLSMEDM